MSISIGHDWFWGECDGCGKKSEIPREFHRLHLSHTGLVVILCDECAKQIKKIPTQKEETTMESEHFRITSTRRINRRQCAIEVKWKLLDAVGRGEFPLTFEVMWPWTGCLHYADVLGDVPPQLKAELTKLIEDFTK